MRRKREREKERERRKGQSERKKREERLKKKQMNRFGDLRGLVVPCPFAGSPEEQRGENRA